MVVTTSLAEEFLDRADIVAGLEQMRSEAMTVMPRVA
jgi:hypothetical protein